MVLSKTIEHDHQAKNLDKTGCINFSDKTEHNDEDNTGNNVDRGKTERITKTKKDLSDKPLVMVIQNSQAY